MESGMQHLTKADGFGTQMTYFEMVNPLTRCVEDYALPPFAQLRVSDIVPAIRTAIQEYALDLNAIEDDLSYFEDEITRESVMDRLEIIDDPLNRLWRVVLHLTSVANSVELREAKAEIQAEVLAIQSRRLQSVEIFEAMQTLRDGPEWPNLTSEQQRILDRAILEMKLNGVTLTGGAKERFNEVDLRLKELADVFSNNVLDATKFSQLIVHDRSELEGLADTALGVFARDAATAGFEGATAKNGPWKLPLDKFGCPRVLAKCSVAATREAAYRAYRTIAGSPPYDNTRVLLEMLQLRQERANLLGYSTFAEMNLADKMAPTVDVVQETLRELRDKCFAVASVEMLELQAFAAAHGQTAPLEPWDINYWVERMRKEKYDLSEELIQSYFPLPTVLTNMFEFISKLFGVRIEPADGLETWHPDVQTYQIRAIEQPDEPVVDDKPCLLTSVDTETMFAVLGFGLRIGLTGAEYTATGRPHGIEWDAVGFSSQFMRNFRFHRETMQSISSHFETGKQLPDDLFDKILESRSFMRATNFADKYLEVAAYDMILHHDYDPFSTSESVFDVFRRESQA
ncbi:unnamed protein product [Aphanomyces euteiches]